MTDAMIERVALAIWAAREKQFPPFTQRKEPDQLDRSSGAWVAVLSQARAAIEAMREPSEAMEKAGDLPGWDDSVSVGLSREVWQAMTDAALAESSEQA